jgi:hypothetical protein
MYWLPVLFVCSTAVDCGFIYADATMAKGECERKLEKLLNSLPYAMPIYDAKGACVEVKIPTI